MSAAKAQEVEAILVRNLLEVFNGRDVIRRQAALDELWSADGVFVDPDGPHKGTLQIDAVVENLFKQYKNFTFSVNGPTRVYPGVGCLPWAYGPAGDPKQITGIDVGVIENGKLISLYTFIDEVLSAPSAM